MVVLDIQIGVRFMVKYLKYPNTWRYAGMLAAALTILAAIFMVIFDRTSQWLMIGPFFVLFCSEMYRWRCEVEPWPFRLRNESD